MEKSKDERWIIIEPVINNRASIKSIAKKTTIEKYDVLYQQLYSWVKKYEKDGQEGLQDRRGKNVRKEESQLTDLEKANLEIKRLKARNEFLEMQDAIEKKLEELEHRYGRFR